MVVLKAIRFHEPGGIDKLQYEDAPDPLIGENEALVRVRGCSLNHLDIWSRMGTRKDHVPMPHISGSDISGEIDRTGKLVFGHEKGERVLVVDDLLATGGTAAAATRLVKRQGAEVVGVAFVIELEFLKGRDRLGGLRVHSLVRY